MNRINLPTFAIKFRETDGKRQIFDFLRRRYVTLTPEEWVRQHFVHFLVEHLGYPQGLLANEVELRVGDKKLRCDTLLYNKEMQPRMIIEYKAPDVELTQRVFEQISAYNSLLQADYLVISNGIEHYCCRRSQEEGGYSFLKEIPLYREL